jgi:hypothetical protein
MNTDSRQYLWLNSTQAVASRADYWNTSDPTDSFFPLGTNGTVNSNGQTYVAYLFAHDAQDFGTGSDESIIKCGSYTGTGSAGNSINLGFEPQWLMIKQSSGANDWYMYDTMRGIATGGNDAVGLKANSSDAEGSSNHLSVTSTGFEFEGGGGGYNGSGATYIYMAIRRPHKPASEFTATDLFALDQGGDGLVPAFNSGFPVDWAWENQNVTTTSNFSFFTRILGDTNRLVPANTGAEVGGNTGRDMDYMDGWVSGSRTSNGYSWMFRRAPGFFDVVAYEGTGSFVWINHNLGVVPEMVLFKGRDYASHWNVFTTQGGTSSHLRLNDTDGNRTTGQSSLWTNLPTATQFRVGSDNEINGSGYDYVAYFFASVDGISKIGTYSGTGSDVNVDCGFTSGARFVLVKRTDSAGGWYLYDSERGIVAGNDPYRLLNVTDAQVTNTDYIDPLSSGFTITSSAPAGLNASGGTYLFYAIA